MKLTTDEIRLIVIVILIFTVGTIVKQYRATHPSPPPAPTPAPGSRWPPLD